MDITPPPSGSWPDWLNWLTYFDADRYRLLSPIPEELGAVIRRTRHEAAVIVLLTDPAAVDRGSGKGPLALFSG